jgi:hypothetical protein
MRFAIHHPAFKSQRLSVQTALGLGGPKLLLNDEIVKRQYGTYPMLSDSGSQFLAQMDVNWVDTIPVVKIGGKSISVAKPLRWFEYAWICVPLLLVFVGGMLGLIVGWGSAIFSTRIFRSDRSARTKYVLAAACSLMGVAVFFAVTAVMKAAFSVRSL